MQASLLVAEGLSKVYPPRRRRGVPIRAVDGVDFEVAAGRVVALVGRSGSGKSTLARCLALLEEPTAGRLLYEGREITVKDRVQLRPRIQLVFQDPSLALSPRFSVIEAIAEPLRIQRRGDRARQDERARYWMREVSLTPELAERRPRELSGGQRQRLIVARALAAEPRVLILDEGLTGLDLSLQAQLINLLLELRERHHLTYVLISHDLRVAAHLADEIAVFDRGRIVERRPPAELLDEPRHRVTVGLVAALTGESLEPGEVEP